MRSMKSWVVREISRAYSSCYGCKAVFDCFFIEILPNGTAAYVSQLLRGIDFDVLEISTQVDYLIRETKPVITKSE